MDTVIRHELMAHRFTGDEMTDNSFEMDKVIPEPHAFIQWKGTNVCMDFRCSCGANCHFDGMFAYTVKCQHCNQIWEMPVNIFPRKADTYTRKYWIDNPQLLQRDEDVDDIEQ